MKIVLKLFHLINSKSVSWFHGGIKVEGIAIAPCRRKIKNCLHFAYKISNVITEYLLFLFSLLNCFHRPPSSSCRTRIYIPDHFLTLALHFVHVLTLNQNEIDCPYYTLSLTERYFMWQDHTYITSKRPFSACVRLPPYQFRCESWEYIFIRCNYSYFLVFTVLFSDTL